MKSSECPFLPRYNKARIELVSENANRGLPFMRPLFLEFEADLPGCTIQDEYLLGSDLLIAPVLQQGARTRELHLPFGNWVHLWTGTGNTVTNNALGNEITAAAAIGESLVFCRADSCWRSIFEKAVDVARGLK